MPQILETDGLNIEFPDSFTLDQIQEFYNNRLPGIREGLKKGAVADLASRIPRDVGLAPSAIMQGLARGWQQFRDASTVRNLRSAGVAAAMSSPVGEEHAVISAANKVADETSAKQEATREQRLADSTLYQLGEETKQATREFYKTNPLLDNSIPAMLSQAVASVPPMIASAAAGPLAPIVAGVTYGAMAGQQGAEEAIAMGHPDKADEAFLLFAGLGALSEAALGYPIAFLRKVAMARRAGVAPEAFGNAVKSRVSIGGRTVREALEGFGRESAQEGTEQLGQNVVASDLAGYDPNRPLMQGVPQAAAIGGVVGAGVGGVGGAAMAIDQARARRAAEAQIPAILRSIETPQPIVRPEDMTPEQAAAQEQAIADFLRDRPTTTPAPPASEPPFFRPPMPQAEPTVAPEPSPAPAPRRRSPIVPEPERPRFRPPSGRDLTGQPEATTKSEPIGSGLVVPEAPQKGVVPVAPPTAPIDISDDAYNAVQAQIDAIEDRIQREGGNPITLYDPRDPRSKALEGYQDWKPMPSELAALYEQRDRIGAAQMDQSVTDIKSRLLSVGFSDAEANRVLESYGIDYKNRDAAAQNFAVEVAQRRVKEPVADQFKTVASALSAERNELTDEFKDISRKTLADAAKAVKSVREYFGISTQPQGTPNAGTIRSSETLSLGQTPEAGQEVGAQVRDAERPAVPQTQTPQAQGAVEPVAQVEAKAKAEVQEVAQVQGPRAAKEIKMELVARLKEALVDAPPASDFAETSYTTVKGKTVVVPAEKQPEKITIEIPGDGTFTIFKTKEAIEEVLKRARKISTSTTPPSGFTRRGVVTKEEAKQFAEEARMSPEEIAEFQASRQQPQTMLETQRQPANIKLLDARPDEISRANLDRLRTRLAEMFGRTYGEQALTGLVPDLSDEGTAISLGLGESSRQAIEHAFGRKLVFFDSTYGVNGAILSDVPGEIYLNIRSTNPLSTVIAHELMEHLAIQTPDLHARLVQVLLEEVKLTKFAEYAEGLRRRGTGGEVTHAEAIKELSADFLAHEWQRPEFWAKLSERMPNVFVRLGRAILNWLDGVIREIRGFRSTEFFRDVERTRNALADAVATFAKSSGAEVRTTSQGGQAQFQLDDVLRSKQSLEAFLAKPTISAEEATSLRQQAGAGAGLVPDSIAQEIEALNPDDIVEGRMATLLDFVLKLHGVAPALELQKILSDANIAEDVKQAAISNVLRQIEHVRIKTTDLEEKLREANAKLANAIQNGPKITKERLVEARAKQIADNLISRYRQYLTAQAANLPANQNLAAARSELIQGMRARLDRNQTESPDSMWKAIERIAERISELPVSEGPIAVTEAIRQKGILRDVAGDPTIDLLTAEKPGGLAPLLASPEAGAMLQELADLQKKAETYAKQIEVIEKAFQGKAPGSPSSTSRFEGEPTPVELKKFAETYRKFRNQQTEAAKAIREMDQLIREADDDVQVYGRSHDILIRLQNDPQFRQQFETAISRPGGEIFRDIIDAQNPELEKVYTSPLVQRNAEGKPFQNTYRIYLAPDREADEATLREMQMLVAEIDEFLQGDVNPVERQTWETRRDYITKYLLQPKFSQKTPMFQFGRVNLNLFGWVQLLFGGRARGPRTELEKMAFRAANEANTTFRTADQAQVGYRLIANNKEFGDAATKVAILTAVASHKNADGESWSTDRITFWDENVLNPILASCQTAGQMRLKAGDFIPGTGIKITKEDMDVAQKQKRYSQCIVQTTQGTAKGLPGLLVENPILIKTTILGRRALRGALSPGQFTMARRFSTWSQLFANAWTKATPAGRRRMVADGEHFQKAVLGYVSTTNPEFANESSLKSVYETFAARAKENEDYQVQSLDQLLDRLSAIAVEKGLYPAVAEALPQVQEKLLSEVGQHVASIQKHFAEEGYTDDTPQTVMQYASAKSAFTTERKNMLAPDPYYDYTLTHDSDRIGFVAAGYQQFQLRQIDALKALKVALDKKEGEFAEEIGRLRHKGMSRRKSAATVQKKSETQLDRTRFSMLRLHAHKRVIDKVLKDLSENVIDVRDPNDSAVLLALSRVTANLSSSLLSSPTALANNLFGGIAANSVILRNLGRASLVGTPVKATAHTTGALVKKVLLTFAPKTLIGRVARSNMPIVNDMAAMVDNQIRNWTQQYLEMQERGLVAPTDMRNRMRAQSALRASAGAIEREPTPLIAAIPNWLESLPGLQQFIGHLRDKVPRLGDEVVNMGAAGVQTSEVFDFLKLQAVKAFEAREAAGEDINASNYFTTEDNLLSPKELGMVESTGYRDSDSLRQMFEIVGNLDGFLRDYYNRQKAAPEGQKHTVPLFENPADEGAVLYDMNAHGNIPTAGFTPPSMAGVGQRGLIKKMLFMFQNYVLRQAAQAERLADKDLRDPKGWREAYALWGIFATLIVWALAGMLATETGVPATQLITGRSPSRVTAANVIADPDAAMLSRYVGMALGNNLPYYGQVISQMLGNPGYGSKWDAANLIPIAGLVRDVNTAITRIGQTGDPVFPAVDFLNRWLPPVSPVLRLLPGVEGDIEARNASRALRVVGPSAGMELAGGGGGQSVQTPASAAVRRLISAAYRGDHDGIRAAFAEAVREKTAQGSADPERSVLQSLASAIPARRVYGKSITPAEEAQLTSKMSGGQRAAYAKGQDAFDLINQTLGTRLSLTSTPRERGQATRRALFTDSATPRFAASRSRSRRRRLGGRRRSGFRRLQIRGASRRRRRSPARVSFAA